MDCPRHKLTTAANRFDERLPPDPVACPSFNHKPEQPQQPLQQLPERALRGACLAPFFFPCLFLPLYPRNGRAGWGSYWAK